MDRRSSGRFSLNGSQFNNLPVAESTQIQRYVLNISAPGLTNKNEIIFAYNSSFLSSPRQSLGNCSYTSNSPSTNRGRIQKTIMSPASKIDPR